MSTVSRVMDMIDNLDLPQAEIDDILRNLRDAVEMRLNHELADYEEDTQLFRTVYRVEVLTDEPFAASDLSDIAYQITEGHASGLVDLVTSAEISREDMRAALIAQGSDPSFLLGEDDDED